MSRKRQTVLNYPEPIGWLVALIEIRISSEKEYDNACSGWWWRYPPSHPGGCNAPYKDKQEILKGLGYGTFSDVMVV